ELNSESNKLIGASTETIVHRAKDILKLQQELKDMGEDDDFEFEYEDDADDDFEYEYEEEDWDEEYEE
ncbi:MAG: GTPase ObgE, partial [Bacteroidaceae bacterium]|nr:GTPase ObgE [Bacteroidaceae bacterium]